MGQIIDDLLNLSRVSRAPLERGIVDLSAVTQEIGTELLEGHPERQVRFSVTPNVLVNGDAGLLRIVMRNFLENAWKFTARRDVAEIEFGTGLLAGKTSYFVRDNGAGFEMAYVDQLYGPFRRLHSDKDFPGTGIGLATVQRIIQRHAGRTWAEGDPGVGATFYFTLGSDLAHYDTTSELNRPDPEVDSPEPQRVSGVLHA